MKLINKKFITRVLYVLLPLVVWIGLWQIIAMRVDRPYFFPDAWITLSALFELLSGGVFWLSALYTLLRVLFGLLLGTVIGTVFAILSNAFSIVYHLIAPIITVIRSTPVATFIVILWVMLSGDALAVLIAVLMVMPIVWQNLLDGFRSINRELIEMSLVFEFSKLKRMRLIVLPALMKYLIPALITSAGLAWKAEIAAEIIAYTTDSIGQMINDAKFDIETPTVFALTVVIVIFSILLEKLMKLLLRRCKV